MKQGNDTSQAKIIDSRPICAANSGIEALGLDATYLNSLCGWYLEERQKLKAYQAKYPGLHEVEATYEVLDISRKHGAAKFLIHAQELVLMRPESFAISNDYTRVKIKLRK